MEMKFEWTEMELKEYQKMLTGPGADLLNRAMIAVARDYEDMLHDPMNGIERIRLAQGALECQGRLVLVMQELLRMQWGQKQEGQADGEDETPAIVLDF